MIVGYHPGFRERPGTDRLAGRHAGERAARRLCRHRRQDVLRKCDNRIIGESPLPGYADASSPIRTSQAWPRCPRETQGGIDTVRERRAVERREDRRGHPARSAPAVPPPCRALP